MSGQRVTVDRTLYVAALADAIDWAESLRDSGDSDPGNLGRLTRYLHEYERITGRPYHPPGPTPTVLVSELLARRYPTPQEDR